MQRWLALQICEGLGSSRDHTDRDLLFQKGEPATHGWFLKQGVVEILQPAANGTSMIVKLLRAPTLFGVIEHLGDEPRYLESVRSLGPAHTISIEREKLLGLLRENPAAALECLHDLGAAFCAAARFEASHVSDTEALLANAFLAYIDVVGEPWDGGTRMQVKRTQVDFAHAIGAAERSVNRVLKEWQARNIVDKTGARYIVHDRGYLERLAGELRGSLVHPPLPPREAA
jgi:CRP-like cAMP-binding protein